MSEMFRLVKSYKGVDALGGRDLYILRHGDDVIFRVYGDDMEVIEEVVVPLWNVGYRVERMVSRGFPSEVLEDVWTEVGGDYIPSEVSLFRYI